MFLRIDKLEIELEKFSKPDPEGGSVPSPQEGDQRPRPVMPSPPRVSR